MLNPADDLFFFLRRKGLVLGVTLRWTLGSLQAVLERGPGDTILYLAAARRIERGLVASMASPMRSTLVFVLRALDLPMAGGEGSWGGITIPGLRPLSTCTIAQSPPVGELQYSTAAPLQEDSDTGQSNEED
jgi:hypothetical protein